jgi:hypothetical protein
VTNLKQKQDQFLKQQPAEQLSKSPPKESQADENQPSESQNSQSPKISSDSSHLDGIAVEEFEGVDVETGEELLEDSAPEILTSEQFFAVFCGVFSISSAVTRLESLRVETTEQTARECSDALYETALEVPAFRFLVEPSSIWMQRGMIVLAFALPKAQAVRMELLSKKAAKDVSPPSQEPTTDHSKHVEPAGAV